MSENANEPTERQVFSQKETPSTPLDEKLNEDEARLISPFTIMRRGEDTVHPVTDQVIFSDFRPEVLPADVEEEPVEIAPKDAYVPAPAPSSESPRNNEPNSSVTSAPVPASKADGTPNPNDDLKRNSSSVQSSGQNEPLA